MKYILTILPDNLTVGGSLDYSQQKSKRKLKRPTSVKIGGNFYN